jgi:hypothetical protein
MVHLAAHQFQYHFLPQTGTKRVLSGDSILFASKLHCEVMGNVSTARILVAEAGVNRYEEGDRTSYAPEEVDGVEKLPNLLTTAAYKRNLLNRKNTKGENKV